MCTDENCKYAHTRDELKSTKHFAKTKICFGKSVWNMILAAFKSILYFVRVRNRLVIAPQNF